MKLHSLKIQNFRAIQDSGLLDFTDSISQPRPVTLIVGPNGSGKTSIFLNQKVEKIFRSNSFSYTPLIHEVGSSSAFNSYAKTLHVISDKEEAWFSSTITNPPNFTSKPKFQSTNLYQKIMTQYNWEDIIKQPDNLDFNFAKQHFRGKEAFKKLIAYINNEFQCNLNYQNFQIEILKQLTENSIIYKDLEKLLLKELQP